MAFDRKLLPYFVRDSLRMYSEDFSTIENGNPFKFRLNGQNYSIHISFIHDSGNTRKNDDEVRIQLSRAIIEKQRDLHNQKYRVGFVGFFNDGNTFLAWDIRHIFSLTAKSMVSVYGRQSQAIATDTHGFSTHFFNSNALEERSFSLALPAAGLGFYLENYEKFHRLSSNKQILHILDLVDHSSFINPPGTSASVEIGEQQQRETFTSTRTAYRRDPAFKRTVLSAYNSSCCICGKQLKLVQAAHIIPHSEDHSNDHVTNGLAMCVQHHKLYDDGLLLPNVDKKLFFNEERAEFLCEAGLDSGLDDVFARSKSPYEVPEDASLRPNPDFLEEGVRLRVF